MSVSLEVCDTCGDTTMVFIKPFETPENLCWHCLFIRSSLMEPAFVHNNLAVYEIELKILIRLLGIANNSDLDEKKKDILALSQIADLLFEEGVRLRNRSDWRMYDRHNQTKNDGSVM